MFDQIFDKYIAQARPAITVAAGEARAWLACIHAELRAIRGAIESDQTAYQRVYEEFILGAGGQATFTIPAGEDWILESVVVEGASGTIVFRLTEPNLYTAVGTQAHAPIYIFGGGGKQYGTDSPNIRIRAATEVLAVSENDAGKYRLTFRKERKRGTSVPAGDFTAPLPTFATSPAAADDAKRHQSIGVFAGVNPTGQARAAHELNGQGAA